jgi:hypothetical protein
VTATAMMPVPAALLDPASRPCGLAVEAWQILEDSLERALTHRLRQLSARMAARSLSLREAVEELHAIHVETARSRAELGVVLDEILSGPVLEHAERRLGEVLPVGPADIPAQLRHRTDFNRGGDLW